MAHRVGKPEAPYGRTRHVEERHGGTPVLRLATQLHGEPVARPSRLRRRAAPMHNWMPSFKLRGKPYNTCMAEKGTSSGRSRRRSPTSREITYGHLATVLAKLGYRSQEQPGSHVVYLRSGKPSLVLPWRSASSRIDSTRLAGVYQLVTGTGVATRQRLDELFRNSLSTVEPKTQTGGRARAAT